MMALKKVHESNSNMYQCPRCKDSAEYDGWYCDSCDTPYEVPFDVIEDIKNWKGEIVEKNKNWQGEDVCPYCYNQLVDIKLKEGENAKQP